MLENSGDERRLGNRRDDAHWPGAARTVSQVDREHAGVARCIQVMGAVGSDSLACSPWPGAGGEDWLSTMWCRCFALGSPQILASALNRDENFVEEPRVAKCSLSSLHRSGVRRPEFPAPLPDALIGDDYPTLSEQILDITKAQAESMIEPNGLDDDHRREAVALTCRRLRRWHDPGAGT